MLSLSPMDIYTYKQGYMFGPSQPHRACSDACNKVQMRYHGADNYPYLSGAAVELLPRFKKGERCRGAVEKSQEENV